MATSSAVTAAPFFPFLFADEPSRLARLFYGYIALGEWECAKATVRQLARHNSARARDMLLELITNGPPGVRACCTAAPLANALAATKFSKAIPAASFLTWLCYAEYIAQGGKSADVAANVLDQADFETALHACNEVATKEQSKLLERLRELSGFRWGRDTRARGMRACAAHSLDRAVRARRRPATRASSKWTCARSSTARSKAACASC